MEYKIFSKGKTEREFLASTVWPKLKEWYEAHGSVPLLWNSCPFHPHKENDFMSNRTPRKKEIERGIKSFFELVDIFDIQHIVCISRKFENTIETMKLNISLEYLRHSSCSGKREFEANIIE